jgi:hypothetical protein
MSVKNIMKKFAESNSITHVSDLLTTGFELEFQDDDDSGEIDWDAYHEAECDAWCNEDPEDYIDDCCDKAQYRILSDLIHGHGLPYDQYKSFHRRLEEIEESARESFEESYRDNCDMDEFRVSDKDTGHRKLSNVKPDQSVSGGEITTNGACTIQEFNSALKYLFDNNSFEIDERCSFHTHLAIKGVNHYYGKRMQSEMMAYILQHMDLLPEAIQERIKGNHRHHKLEVVSGEKFCAIRFHPSFGTWEFRLFGAAESYADGIKCLLLAYKAMRHAYRVKLKMDKPLVEDIEAFNGALCSINMDLGSVAKSIKSNEYNYSQGA